MAFPPRTSASATAGRNQRDLLCDLRASKGFNTEVTEILRALRVEGLMATEYTEPLLGDDRLILTQGERILARCEGFRIQCYRMVH